MRVEMRVNACVEGCVEGCVKDRKNTWGHTMRTSPHGLWHGRSSRIRSTRVDIRNGIFVGVEQMGGCQLRTMNDVSKVPCLAGNGQDSLEGLIGIIGITQLNMT